MIYTIRFTELERRIATLIQENNTLRQDIIRLVDADGDIRTQCERDIRRVDALISNNMYNIERDINTRPQFVRDNDPIYGMFGAMIDDVLDEIRNNRVINTQARDTDTLFVTAIHTDLMTKFENISATFAVLFRIMREMCREMRAIEPRVDSEIDAIQSALITRFERIMTDRGGLFQDILDLQARIGVMETHIHTL